MSLHPLLLFVLAPVVASGPWQPVALTDSLGSEIDAVAQARYHLLPDVRDLMSARFLRGPHGAFRLTYLTGSGRARSLEVSPTAIEHTRLHARFVEEYWEARATGEPPAACATRAFLLLASRGEYDAAWRLADAALEEAQGDSALMALREAAAILRRSRGLFLPGSLYDRSGRTELLVFSGYYGVWLGIALWTAA